MGWIVFIIILIVIIIITVAVASDEKERREKRLVEISRKLQKTKPFNSEYRVYNFPVKGLLHRPVESWDRARRLIRDENLQLVPEPENPYDINAIKVLTLDGIDIGYVDAKHSRVISRCLKEYGNHKCYVSEIVYSQVSYVYALAAFYPENF